MTALGGRLDRLFDCLDDLPDTLYQRAVTLRHGSLEMRVAGLLAWRRALLAGALPDIDAIGWPEPELARTLLRRIEGLDLLPLCQDAPDLVDHILLDVCTAIETIEEWQAAGLEGLFDDILEQTIRRRERPSELPPDGEEQRPDLSGSDNTAGVPSSTPATTGSMPDAASPGSIRTPGVSESPPSLDERAGEPQPTDEPLDGIDRLLENGWRSAAKQWRIIRETADSLAASPGRGWDLGLGRGLQPADLRLFTRYRRLLQAHDELRHIVAALGRSRPRAARNEPPEPVHHCRGEVEGLSNVRCECRAAVPMAHEGVQRGDDVSRMLPAEAQLLGHPRLRLLWHARRAERALHVYAVRGVHSAHEPERRPVDPDPPPRRMKHEPAHGPIIVCLDSSASMAGLPGLLARAVTLETLRLANAENRDCLLARFSGPGQIEWLPLRFDARGWRALLTFLRSDERGGTDLSGALRAALARNREERWRQADMLLITDGRFPSDPELVRAVADARRETGLRLIGLQLGNWSDRALASLCDAIHHFRNLSQWRQRLEAAGLLNDKALEEHVSTH